MVIKIDSLGIKSFFLNHSICFGLGISKRERDKLGTGILVKLYNRKYKHAKMHLFLIWYWNCFRCFGFRHLWQYVTLHHHESVCWATLNFYRNCSSSAWDLQSVSLLSLYLSLFFRTSYLTYPESLTAS